MKTSRIQSLRNFISEVVETRVLVSVEGSAQRHDDKGAHGGGMQSAYRAARPGLPSNKGMRKLFWM